MAWLCVSAAANHLQGEQRHQGNVPVTKEPDDLRFCTLVLQFHLIGPWRAKAIMCYQVQELYALCRCLYYQSAVDRCPAYGQPGHGIQQRTIYVGSSCSLHSQQANLAIPPQDDDATDDYGGESVLTDDSTAATSLTTPEKTEAANAIELFLHDLVTDPELQYLLPQLVRSAVTRRAAQIIFFDLLQWYAADLRGAGTTPLEDKAANLIDTSCLRMALRLVYIFGNQLRLENFFDADGVARQDIDDYDQEDVERSDLRVSYSSLYKFLFSGRPFAALKNTIRIVVETQTLCERPESSWTRVVDLTYSLYQHHSVPTRKIKSGVDIKAGTERIEWTCVS